MIDKSQRKEFGQDTGIHPYSFREVSWDFLMTTEHQDLGLRTDVPLQHLLLSDHTSGQTKRKALAPGQSWAQSHPLRWLVYHERLRLSICRGFWQWLCGAR